MTKIEIKDLGYYTLLSIWTGTDRGAATATLIYLTPKQRQQLLKVLQHPTPHQPKQQHGQDH